MFKRKHNVLPAISTASLPDIVFIILCFFMMITALRDNDIKLKVEVPKVTERTSLNPKTLISYIYIGRLKEPRGCRIGPKLLLNDQLGTVGDIPLFLESRPARKVDNFFPLLTVSLKVDKDVEMGMVEDVKKQLRKSGQLKVSYSAKPRLKNL